MSGQGDHAYLPESHDSELYLRGQNKKGPIKLDLDRIAQGNSFEVNGFLRHLEDMIDIRIRKKKIENCYDFRTLPFLWRPPNHYDGPLDDPTLGAFTSLSEFADAMEDQRYLLTDLEDFKCKKMQYSKSLEIILPNQLAQMEKINATTFWTLYTDLNNQSLEQLKLAYVNFFSGGKFDCKGNIGFFLDPENINQIRNTLKEVIDCMTGMLPDQLYKQFMLGRVHNWSSIKQQLRAYKGCKKEEPSILRLRALLKSVMSLHKSGVKVQSLIANFRMGLEPFFRKYGVLNLEEVDGENIGFKGRDQYGPVLNLILMLLVTMSESHSYVEDCFLELAKLKTKTIDELSITHILDNKKFLYKKFNIKQNAVSDFKLLTWNRAYEKDADKALDGYLEKIKPAKNQEFQKPNIPTKAYHLDEPNRPVPEPEDEFFCLYQDEDNLQDSFMPFNAFIKQNARGGQRFKGRISGPFRKPNNGRGWTEPSRPKQKFPTYAGHDNNNRGNKGGFSDRRDKLRKKAGAFRNRSSDQNFKGRRYGAVFTQDEYDEVVDCLFQALDVEDTDYETEPLTSAAEMQPPMLGRLGKPLNLLMMRIDPIIQTFEETITGETINTVTTHLNNSVTDQDSLNKNVKNNMEVFSSGISITLDTERGTETASLILDSGASRTLVNVGLLNRIKNVRKKRVKVANGAGAAGGKIELLDYLASFTLKCKKYDLEVKDAVVTASGPENTVLFGVPDLMRNRWSCECIGDDTVVMKFRGIDVERVEEHIFNNVLHEWNTAMTENEVEKKTMGLPESDNVVINFDVDGDMLKVDRDLKEKGSSEAEVEDLGDVPIDTKEKIWENPNSDYTFWTEMDRILQKLKNTSTMGDIRIDPLGEVAAMNRPEDKNIRDEILEICSRYPILWNADTGCVEDEQYVVTGHIDDRFTSKRVKSYFSKMPNDILKSLIARLNDEIANGILIKLPKDMDIKNIISIFAVGKKNEIGEIVLNPQNCRLVIDCKRNLNEATNYKPTQTDGISEIIQTIAKYSKGGYVAVMDIQSMFFCFKLDKSLWPYFVIEHPQMGLFCYTRCPMGWVVSPSMTREFMLRILYKFNNNLRRYLDDIVVYHETKEGFLKVLDGVLKTLDHHNFRLKGSKFKVLGTTIKLLGKNIKEGTIQANPHTIKNLNEMTWENMTTKLSVKKFLGCGAYIAEHMAYSAELFHDLRQEAAGVNNADFNWTPELKASLAKVKLAINRLLTLHPVDPEKEIYGVFDSSFMANACFFYQLDGKKKNFIKIFSRRRTDADNKFRPSSCYVELSGITAGMIAASVELELCNKKVIILTDSKSCADLYKRLRNTKVPSQDRKINDCFAKLMAYNYEINYIKATEPALEFADYISRTKAASTLCTGCVVCDAVDSSADIFYTQLANLSAMTGEQKFENITMPTLAYNMFLKIQRPIRMNTVVTKEYTHPYGSDNGWINSLVPSPDLHGLRSQNMSMLYMTTRNNKLIDYELNITTLLADVERLHEWQNMDKTYRKSKEILRAGIDPPNSCQKTVTLIVNQQCLLHSETGLLVKPYRDRLYRVRYLIMLPEKAGPQVVHAVHKSFGHGAVSRLENEVKRLFQIPNVSNHIVSLVSQCKGCTRLKRGPKVLREQRNFDSELIQAERIGIRILADEMHRTVPNPMSEGRITRSTLADTQSIKLFFASEYLTRYAYAELITGNLTSEKLKLILYNMKDRLCPTETDNTQILIRMDSVSTHAALVDDPDIKDEGMQLMLHSKQTGSKNSLAPLDSRMAKFSRLLNVQLSIPGTTKVQAIRKALIDYNDTVGSEGYRPTELFHGRLMNGKTFRVPIERLRQATMETNEISRRSKMEKLKMSIKSRPMSFVEYKPGMTYTNRHEMPLKIGDYLLIDYEEYRKNDFRPFFKIVKSDGYETGVNWDDGLISTQRVGVKSNQLYIWDFNWVKEVTDGAQPFDFNVFDANVTVENIRALREDYGPLDIENYVNLVTETVHNF